MQNGFRVTILEARDRIGGRVHQKQLANGHLVDLGPNWIHGTDDNPILDIAKQTNTTARNSDSSTWVYDHSGDLLPLEDGEKYSTMMWDIVQQAFEHSNTYGAETHVDKSLLDFVHEKLPDLVPGNDPDCDKKRAIVLRMAEMWGAFVGSPVSRQSLKYFWLEECIEGGDFPPERPTCYTRRLTLIRKPILRRNLQENLDPHRRPGQGSRRYQTQHQSNPNSIPTRQQ